LAQHTDQRQGARVLPALARRRRQVQHAVGQAGQTLQAGRLVQVATKRRDAARAQLTGAVGAGGQRQHAHPAGERLRHAQPDIAAANDEQALAAKAGWQRAGAGGIQTAARVLV
jgi:hypothetical protein